LERIVLTIKHVKHPAAVTCLFPTFCRELNMVLCWLLLPHDKV
jgi:hypothetical protein